VGNAKTPEKAIGRQVGDPAHAVGAGVQVPTHAFGRLVIKLAQAKGVQSFVGGVDIGSGGHRTFSRSM
jgi:hypothetical protein